MSIYYQHVSVHFNRIWILSRHGKVDDLTEMFQAKTTLIRLRGFTSKIT